MAPYDKHLPSRRQALKRGVLSAATLLCPASTMAWAQGLPALDVASAGSIRAMLDGPLKDATAQELHLDLHSHSGGADAMARAILNGSQPADVFIPITEGPMRTVMEAGNAEVAYPIARTEMVILYSAKSRFAPEFAAAAESKRHWWEVLQEPGLKLARSNPLDDPSGRCMIFAMMLAAKKYGQPDLVEKVLGPMLNPEQVLPGTNVRAALENGTIDAAGSYRIATRRGSVPFLILPADVNLSDMQVRKQHADLSFSLGEKTFYPEPTVFYAATLKSAGNPKGAMQFVNWLQTGPATRLFEANGFSPPTEAVPLYHS